MQRRWFLRVATMGIGFAVLNPLHLIAKNLPPARPLPVTPARIQDVIGLMRIARDKFYQGELKTARKVYENILNIRPGYLPAYDRIGAILNAQKKFAQTVQLFREAVKANPQNPYFATRLAKALRIQALNTKKSENTHSTLLEESVELTKRSLNNGLHKNQPGLILQKTQRIVADRNTKVKKGARGQALLSLPADVNVSPATRKPARKISDMKTLLARSERLRLPLFDTNKERFRLEEVLKFQKKILRSELQSIVDPNDRLKAARAILAKDPSDSFSYHTVRTLARNAKDYGILETISHLRTGSGSNPYARLGECNDLIFCYQHTRVKRYINSAEKTMRELVAKGKTDDPRLNSSIALVYARILTLRNDFKKASDFILQTLEDSVPQESYLRNHLLIAFAKNLETNNNQLLAQQALTLIVDPTTDHPELTKMARYLSATAGTLTRENLPVYQALYRVTIQNKDREGSLRASTLIRSLDRKTKREK